MGRFYGSGRRYTKYLRVGALEDTTKSATSMVVVEGTSSPTRPRVFTV